MSLWNTAKDILGVVAPSLGTAIGGPLGGIAAKTIATKLLGDSEASEELIAAAVTNATPEQLAMLKKAELEFKSELKKLDIDLAKIHADDRDSARKRQVAMKDHVPSVLAVLTLVAFFGYIGAVTFWPQSVSADIGFINIAVGWLGGTASTVVAYYFGSSNDGKPEPK